ncbi:MAG: transglycosylase SLT domain-containing protein, partial [Candidatus Omnitrophica bacterium]|nr:transglycosylase SLT domain-containing protein [Candidatus Omnitrophota bacterium]
MLIQGVKFVKKIIFRGLGNRRLPANGSGALEIVDDDKVTGSPSSRLPATTGTSRATLTKYKSKMTSSNRGPVAGSPIEFYRQERINGGLLDDDVGDIVRSKTMKELLLKWLLPLTNLLKTFQSLSFSSGKIVIPAINKVKINAQAVILIAKLAWIKNSEARVAANKIGTMLLTKLLAISSLLLFVKYPFIAILSIVFMGLAVKRIIFRGLGNRRLPANDSWALKNYKDNKVAGGPFVASQPQRRASPATFNDIPTSATWAEGNHQLKIGGPVAGSPLFTKEDLIDIGRRKHLEVYFSASLMKKPWLENNPKVINSLIEAISKLPPGILEMVDLSKLPDARVPVFVDLRDLKDENNGKASRRMGRATIYLSGRIVKIGRWIIKVRGDKLAKTFLHELIHVFSSAKSKDASNIISSQDWREIEKVGGFVESFLLEDSKYKVDVFGELYNTAKSIWVLREKGRYVSYIRRSIWDHLEGEGLIKRESGFPRYPYIEKKIEGRKEKIYLKFATITRNRAMREFPEEFLAYLFTDYFFKPLKVKERHPALIPIFQRIEEKIRSKKAPIVSSAVTRGGLKIRHILIGAGLLAAIFELWPEKSVEGRGDRSSLCVTDFLLKTKANGVQSGYVWDTTEEKEKAKIFPSKRITKQDASAKRTSKEAIERVFKGVAEQSGMDERFIWAIGEAESDGSQYNKDGTVKESGKGAAGRMQVTPIAIREVNRQIKRGNKVVIKLLEGEKADWQRVKFDEEHNIRVGTAYLYIHWDFFRRQQLVSINGKWRLVRKPLSYFKNGGRRNFRFERPPVAAYNSGPKIVIESLQQHGPEWYEYLYTETKGHRERFLERYYKAKSASSPIVNQPIIRNAKQPNDRIPETLEDFVTIFGNDEAIKGNVNYDIIAALAAQWNEKDLEVVVRRMRNTLAIYHALAALRKSNAELLAQFEEDNPGKEAGSILNQLAEQTHTSWFNGEKQKSSYIEYTQQLHDFLARYIKLSMVKVEDGLGQGYALILGEFENPRKKFKLKVSNFEFSSDEQRIQFSAEFRKITGKNFDEDVVINTISGEWDVLNNIKVQTNPETWSS